MTKQIKDTRERGVALLFALGLLALMSVLGVAFVTNALNAQKTAVNIGARNQSRILLDSAINRVMIGITAALHQRVNADLSKVYSSGDGTVRAAKDDKDSKQDLLNNANGRMKIFIPGQNMYQMSDSKSTWVYVRDAENKVVGRMAYQVLPQGKTSIGLNDVLLGIYNHDEWSSNHGKAGSNSVRSSWNSRVGKDISELNFGPANRENDAGEINSGVKEAGTEIKVPKMPFVAEWKADDNFEANIYTTPFSKTNPFLMVSSFNDFFAGVFYNNIVAKEVPGVTGNKRLLTKELQQTWFRRWFNDGKDTFPEAFYRGSDEDISKTSVLHRFNLGHIEGDTTGEKWYDTKRFANCNPEADGFQNKTVVDRLLKDAADFAPGDDKVSAEVADGSGLPFLTIIGKDKGSFARLEDRRKQIVANLNDYCDKDNTPTSDVSASEWSNDKMPKYTGNEKTPYINELMYSLKFAVKEDTNSNSIVLSVTPALKFFAELINIYDEIPDLSAYKFKTWLKMKPQESMTVEVVEAKGEVTLEGESVPQPFDSVNVSGIFVGEGNASSFPEVKDLYGEVSLTGKAFTKGYLVVEENMNVFSGFDQKIDLNSAINGKFSGKTITSRKLTSFKLKISNVKLDFVAAGLFDSANGVDFVRAPDENGVLITFGDDANAATIGFNVSDAGVITPVNAETVADGDTVYLSGIEVRDPRQNLNLTKNTTQGVDFVTAASDWKCDPKLQVRETADESDIGSMRVKGKTAEFSGQKNDCSNPSEPFSDTDKYSSDNSVNWKKNCDRENVTDPAYIDDGTTKRFMSTAYIANAPMRSLWELGAIHRGKAWQTINLKWAGGSAADSTFSYQDNKYNNADKLSQEGISYEQGDGGILDQVKLTSATHSSGKVNVNMLHTYSDEEGTVTADANKTYVKYPVFKEWDKTIIKALLYNIPYNQQLKDFRDEIKEGKLPGTGEGVSGVQKIGWNQISDGQGGVIEAFQTKPASGDYPSRAAFIGRYTENSYFGDAFGIIGGWNDLADAQQEEFIGKTINLLTAEPTAQTTIRAIVVVQTIKSINAEDNTEITKTALKSDNSVQILSKPVTKKDFDFLTYADGDKTKYMYFDEITSEVRALVTIRKIQKNGAIRLQLHSIQYY